MKQKPFHYEVRSFPAFGQRQLAQKDRIYRISSISFRFNIYCLKFEGVVGTWDYRHFQSLASNAALHQAIPNLQIAALNTTFEKLQDSSFRSLKRKLESTTLDLERAQMEREDFRQGGGPRPVWDGPVESSDTLPLLRYVETLQDSEEEKENTILEAWNLLSAGWDIEARQILREAASEILHDESSSTRL